MDAVAEWESTGTTLRVGGHDVFVVDRGPRRAETVLILHGFPTCSFDWRRVVPLLIDSRRVVTLDLLGYGLSQKPLDRAYSLFDQADVVQELGAVIGLDEVVLVTHDMGNSVGGEVLARALEGTLGFEITRRVLTNGSVYIDMAQLSAGQQMLLALPDRTLPPEQALPKELFAAGLPPTFGAATQPDDEEIDAQWELLARAGGNRLLPRLIRYIEERRVHEHRWTGAVERHPAPLSIVWGDADPIAVWPMAERLKAARPDARLQRLEGIGHWPMIEVPEAVVAAIARG